MAVPKIKTLLIEDSGFMRIFLSDILRSDIGIEVVATAINGFEGVEKVKALKPDVVITDMIMPHYDGLYVVRQLMKEMPLPIILLSSLDRTDPQIFDALREGAFDFIDKPREKDISSGYSNLTRMIREASLTDYLRLKSRNQGRNTAVHTFEPRLNYDIIAFGASTGGPSAIEHIINNFPINLNIPVIIAQHMPHRFIESFAARLADTTGLSVRVATEGESLLGNHIYLAPGTSNIRVKRAMGSAVTIEFVQQEYKEFNHPSVDCLFESIGEVYGKRSLAVILTGMGKDGTQGLHKIKERGGFTVSQDETSSVVYGMPRVAFETGAARYQIPLSEIPNFIISAL